MSGKIIIKGAREHNLQDIDLELPRDRFIVITGISGSGPHSPLTRYTPRARGGTGVPLSLCKAVPRQMKKPEIDYIEGLSLQYPLTRKPRG